VDRVIFDECPAAQVATALDAVFGSAEVLDDKRFGVGD